MSVYFEFSIFCHEVRSMMTSLLDEKVANFNIKIICWLVVGLWWTTWILSWQMYFVYLKMMSYLEPYMDTIRIIPMSLSDLISVHSMFQLLHNTYQYLYDYSQLNWSFPNAELILTDFFDLNHYLLIFSSYLPIFD